MLWKGRELLPCMAAEVYSQLTQSCLQDFERGCISMECFWSHFSARQASGCTPGKWHIPAWWFMKLVLRKTTACLCRLLKLRGVGASPVPPKPVPPSRVTSWNLSHSLVYLPFKVNLDSSVDLRNVEEISHKVLRSLWVKGTGNLKL